MNKRVLRQRTKRLNPLVSGVSELTRIEQSKWTNDVSWYVREVPVRLI